MANLTEKIKMTPNQKLAQTESERLYSMYNQDGVTPLNFIPGGIEFYENGYKYEVTVVTRKSNKKSI